MLCQLVRLIVRLDNSQDSRKFVFVFVCVCDTLLYTFINVYIKLRAWKKNSALYKLTSFSPTSYAYYKQNQKTFMPHKYLQMVRACVRVYVFCFVLLCLSFILACTFYRKIKISYEHTHTHTRCHSYCYPFYINFHFYYLNISY